MTIRIPYDEIAAAVLSTVELASKRDSKDMRAVVEDLQLLALDKLESLLARALQASGVGADAAAFSAQCFVASVAAHAVASRA